MQKKESIIAIVGPTASGKSEYAVKLAKKYNGEIISADSRQVYRGLDIGSGKVMGKWVSSRHCDSAMAGEAIRRTNNGIASSSDGHRSPRNDNFIFVYKTIPHHCIDYVSPQKRFTVVDFQQCARQAMEDIRARGKIPFLVGGTGFYIDAVLGNASFPSVLPNALLRKKLERFSAEKLFAMLKKSDPRRAAAIDPRNKRRLIRALEIIHATNKSVPPCTPSRALSARDAVVMGIKKEKEVLKKSIAKRMRAMLKRGLVAETKKLRSQGLTWKRIAEFGFEYRLPVLFLQKKISRKELEDRLIKENWRYAKRQMTWWRRNKNIHWVSSLLKTQQLIRTAL